jgi:hypothetical protein
MVILQKQTGKIKRNFAARNVDIAKMLTITLRRISQHRLYQPAYCHPLRNCQRLLKIGITNPAVLSGGVVDLNQTRSKEDAWCESI